jgi:hypothetical protein
MVYFVPEKDIRATSKQETSAIVRELKDNRAAGQGSITAEAAEDGGRIMWYKSHTVIKRVWKEEQMPEDCNNAITFQMYEKGSKMEFYS